MCVLSRQYMCVRRVRFKFTRTQLCFRPTLYRVADVRALAQPLGPAPPGPAFAEEVGSDSCFGCGDLQKKKQPGYPYQALPIIPPTPPVTGWKGKKKRLSPSESVETIQHAQNVGGYWCLFCGYNSGNPI